MDLAAEGGGVNGDPDNERQQQQQQQPAEDASWMRRTPLFCLARNHPEEFVQSLEQRDDSELDRDENADVLEILCSQVDLPFAAIQAYVGKRPARIGMPSERFGSDTSALELALSRKIEGNRRQRRQNYPTLRNRANYEQVALCLIGACPEAVSLPTSKCDTLLDIAVKANAPITVLRALLEVDPSLSKPDHSSTQVMTLAGLCSRMDTLSHYNAFDKMDLILLTHFHGRVVEGEAFLLHTASQIQRMPPSYFRDVLRRHPEQASIADPQTGNLPLHFMCALEGNHSFAVETRNMIKLLVEVYPKAAVLTNSRGELPLHIAIKANSHDSLSNTEFSLFEILIRANSDALCVADPETGLVPFQEVARDIYLFPHHISFILVDGIRQPWHGNLDRSYALLRLDPNALMSRGVEGVIATTIQRSRKRKRTIGIKESDDPCGTTGR